MGRKAILRLDCAAFFRPEEFAVLKQAVDAAWRILLSHGAINDNAAKLILAKGVMNAARRGERELNALTFAACRHWVRNSAPNRQRGRGLQRSAAVH